MPTFWILIWSPVLLLCLSLTHNARKLGSTFAAATKKKRLRLSSIHTCDLSCFRCPAHQKEIACRSFLSSPSVLRGHLSRHNAFLDSCFCFVRAEDNNQPTYMTWNLTVQVRFEKHVNMMRWEILGAIEKKIEANIFPTHCSHTCSLFAQGTTNASQQIC